jgi:hypothetical protein
MSFEKTTAIIATSIAIGGATPSTSVAQAQNRYPLSVHIEPGNQNHELAIIEYKDIKPPHYYQGGSVGDPGPSYQGPLDGITQLYNSGSYTSTYYKFNKISYPPEGYVWETRSRLLCLGGSVVRLTESYYPGSFEPNPKTKTITYHDSSTCHDEKLTGTYINDIEHNFPYNVKVPAVST